MYPNPGDFEAALARSRDLLLAAERERALLALRAGMPPSRGRGRLGALLIRVGRRLEGAERPSLTVTPVARGRAATRG